MKRRRAAAVAALALAALVAVGCTAPAWQYLRYRLAPDRAPAEGDFRIASERIAGPATVYLDAYGVPHIRAESERALYFAYGYMQARDRRFQMELLRRIAAGRLRELVGERGKGGPVERMEVFSRMLGLHLDGARLYAQLPDEDRAVLEAFADGVNEATTREPLPMEFRLLSQSPEPWRGEDSALILAMISFGLCKNWEQELGRLELIVHHLRTGGTIDRALAIWRPRYALPPHLIGERPEVDPFADVLPIAPELAEYLVETYGPSPLTSGPSPMAGRRGAGGEGLLYAEPGWPDPFRGGASNNWAMGGTWTGTGAGALSSDPHMPHAIPPLGYLVHLACEGCAGGSYQVIGGGFVGLPAVSFGTNGRVAWGATSNWADAVDLYVERPAPGRPGQYLTPDGPAPFAVREEVFRIHADDGSFREERRSVRSTIHGVLLNDFVDRLPADFPLVALRRDTDPGRPIAALRALYRAETVTEGRIALRDFSAMIGHWVLADREGSVAYTGTVRLPRRTRHLGTVPVPGWVRDYEWEGFFDPADLPYVENPPTGFVGSANNQVVQPESFGHPINFEGNVAHRWSRIAEVLSRGSDGRPIAAQIGSLQTDDVDPGFLELLPRYAPIWKDLATDADPRVAAAARALLDWDGRCRTGTNAPAIFQALVARLLSATLEDEVGDQTLRFLQTYFNVEPFLFSVLGDFENPAWDDRRTPGIERAQDVIAASLRRAVDALSREHGSDPATWTLERVIPFALHHPFGEEKALAGFLNRGPLPTRGVGESVNKHQFTRDDPARFPVRYGAVLRVMIDLADLPGSRMSLPGGESGRPTSPHYDDQIGLFVDGDGISMDMDLERIAARAAARFEFAPAGR